MRKKKKILGGGESKGFLKGAGIADCLGCREQRTDDDQFFGIVEGGTPCFVYRGKAEDLDPRELSFN